MSGDVVPRGKPAPRDGKEEVGTGTGTDTDEDKRKNTDEKKDKGGKGNREGDGDENGERGGEELARDQDHIKRKQRSGGRREGGADANR